MAKPLRTPPRTEEGFTHKLKNFARFLDNELETVLEETSLWGSALDVTTILKKVDFKYCFGELVENQQAQILNVIEKRNISITIERDEQSKMIDIIFSPAQADTATPKDDEEVEFSGQCHECKRIVTIKGRRSQAIKQKVKKPKRGKPYVDYDWPVTVPCECIHKKLGRPREVTVFYREFQN